jgi:hypothetical protein
MSADGPLLWKKNVEVSGAVDETVIVTTPSAVLPVPSATRYVKVSLPLNPASGT